MLSYEEWLEAEFAKAEQERDEALYRLEKIRQRANPDREQRQSDPQTVLDSIYAHAVAGVAKGHHRG